MTPEEYLKILKECIAHASWVYENDPRHEAIEFIEALMESRIRDWREDQNNFRHGSGI